MLHLNPNTGSISFGNVTLKDAEILSRMSESICLEPGTESNFNLQSIQLLLEKYPTLQQLGKRAHYFLQAMLQPAQPSPALDSLALRRYSTVSESELSVVKVHMPLVNGQIQIDSLPIPSVSLRTGVYFSGRKHGEVHDIGLLGIPVSALKQLPIQIGQDEVLMTKTYAVAGTSEIDDSRTTQQNYLEKNTTISLQEMLMTILIELYLEDE